MKTKNYPIYVFYFPYRGAGGVPLLFLRLAEYLANNYSIVSYVIDYTDGYMALNRKNTLIEILPYVEDGSISIPDDSIIIFQSDLPWGIPKNLKTNNSTKVFFWNCYPFNLIPVFPSPIKEFTSRSLVTTKFVLNTFLFFSKLKSIKLLKTMLSNNAISFMDGPNLTTSEYCLGIKIINPKFLPILVQTSSQQIIQSTFNKSKKLTLCWVGRVADFKIHILNRALEDAYIYAEKNKLLIDFLIIGSGNEENNLFHPLTNCEYFKILKISYLSEKDLNQILVEKVDCLFAMGTSALEGAKLSVPSVLLNFSYDKVESGYKYNFLHESENFSLGEIITSKNYKNGYSFDEIILSLKDDKLGKKCLDYFLDHHTIEKNFSLFLDQTQSSVLSYNDLISRNNLNKPFFYIIWKLVKKLLALRK